MSIGISNNYSSVYESTYAAQKQQAAKKETSATQKSSGSVSSNDYLGQLTKLAPSVEFRVGNTHATDKSGKTLTINPNLLEKMQKNPELESEMKELIKGVEYMTKLSESMAKASGRTIVFQHSYIDANGKYSCSSLTIRKDELNEKLRKESQENSEKLIEKTRENARKKTEQLKELLEEKAEEAKESDKKQEKIDAEKAESDTANSKAEKLIEEKIESAEEGKIFFDDEDMQTIIEEMSSADNTNAAISETIGFDIKV